MSPWLISTMIAAATFASAKEWVAETLYENYHQTFSVEEMLYQNKTPYQDMAIFRNETFGRVLVLDGAIQLTEKDEFVYHEMMTHVPLLAHGHAKNVLVIGGGDGGILREVLKHKAVEKVTLVEIDPDVVAFSKKHLPFISQGALDDPRVRIVIEDGAKFVKETEEKYDVIICDSTDPDEPVGAVLFTSEFYRDCHNRLSDGGIFVNQNGVPFLQKAELVDTLRKRREHFKDVSYYLAVVPTYIGGFMALGWASDNPELRKISVEQLQERLKNVQGDLRYYTPALHQASFVLPKFIEESIQ